MPIEEFLNQFEVAESASRKLKMKGTVKSPVKTLLLSEFALF